MTNCDLTELIRRKVAADPLAAYSAVLGRPSFKKRGVEFYTKSPFREDQRWSLRIHGEKGTWYDDPDTTGGDIFALYARMHSLDCKARFSAVVDGVAGCLAINGHANQPTTREASKPRVVARYDYRDEKRQLLFQVGRLEPKEFRQRRPDGKGAWIYNLDGVRRAPYRLPELVAALVDERVFVPEGEKDADALAKLGLAATTNPGGAGKWRNEYNAHFKARRVVILADNDAPGRKHARQVAHELLGVAFETRIVELPGLAEKGDVSDWLAAGGTKEQLLALVEGAKPVICEDLEEPPVTAVEAAPADDEDEAEDEAEAEPLTLPEAAWRGPFADYRAAMTGILEAPDSAHFAALWAAGAARLRRRVWTYYASTLYPNVYLVNFGTTGDSKTSAQRIGIGLLPEDGSVKILRGVGSAEALGDWMIQPEDGVKASHLISLEELGTLLTRGAWDGSTLISFLTEAFDTPPVFEIPYRKNPVKVAEPTPTLLAGTTPDWFWKSMKEADFHGGFGNRLFFLTGPAKPPIARPTRPEALKLAPVRAALDRLSRVHPGEMDLAPDANELWEGFYRAWKETAANFEPLLAAATKRIHTYAMKLPLVYAAFEGTAPTITRNQMAASIQVAHYGIRCARALLGRRASASTVGRCEQAILKALVNAKLPGWKIHNRIGGNRFTSEDLNRALRGLATAGHIIEVGKTARGHVTYALRAGAGS